MKLAPLTGTPWRAQTAAMRAATLVVALGLLLGAIAVAILTVCLLAFPGAPTHALGHSIYPILYKEHIVFTSRALALAYSSALPILEIGCVVVALALAIHDRIESRRNRSPNEDQPRRFRFQGMGAFWRRPFQERLGLLQVGLAAAYLVLNIGFSVYCVPTMSAGYDRGFCTVGKSFWFLDRLIPAIWRGVDVFGEAGNPSTANVVRAVTEFIWGSALCFMAAMVVVSFAWFWALSSAERAQLRTLFEEQMRRRELKRERVKTAHRSGLLMLFFVFGLAFYGNFEYDDIAHRAHNIYVQPVDFLFLILELFLLMFGVAILTGNWIRVLVLRSTNAMSQDDLASKS